KDQPGESAHGGETPQWQDWVHSNRTVKPRQEGRKSPSVKRRGFPDALRRVSTSKPPGDPLPVAAKGATQFPRNSIVQVLQVRVDAVRLLVGFAARGLVELHPLRRQPRQGYPGVLLPLQHPP